MSVMYDESYESDYDEGLDPEGPSAEDLDRFGSEYRRCASCGASFYDQATVCPSCGHIAGQPQPERTLVGPADSDLAGHARRADDGALSPVSR